MGNSQFEQRTKSLSFKDATSSGLGAGLLPEDGGGGGGGSTKETSSAAALKAKLLG